MPIVCDDMLSSFFSDSTQVILLWLNDQFIQCDSLVEPLVEPRGRIELRGIRPAV